MGRRKIDIQYLQDDRVRKVTFCKRKGGLFKKADDLAKLCGVEVAVIIIQENDKLCTYASTMNDVDRVINRYQGLSSGAPVGPDTTIDKLYQELEIRRRELEETQRQLLQERKKVEAFVGQDVQMLTVRPVDMGQMNTSNAVQVPGGQSWPVNGQQIAQPIVQMPDVTDPPQLLQMAAICEQPQEQQAAQGEAWESKDEPPAKRTKLDMAAEIVASAQ
jgi:hypothetical protein